MTGDSSRRSFLGVLAATAGAAALPRPAGSATAPVPAAPSNAKPTIATVIEAVVSGIPGAPRTNTVDVVKAGDPEQTCTGVVTTFLGTLDVLRKAKGLAANLVISHEPVFYSHLDKTDWLAGDRVYQAKRRFLDENRLVVWRAHDTWRLSLGAAGGESQITMRRQTDVDALVVGELHEWETSEYVRDSAAAGWPKAVIVVGHEASEEAGMRALADWLRPRVAGVSVTHLPAGDAFTYV